MKTCIVALSLLLVANCVPGHAQKSDTSFPTDDEIQLVLTQTERAVQQYGLLLDREESLMGPQGKEAAQKDREVVTNLGTAVRAFKLHPQKFNGPLGFAFFEWLDDASRNANLCAMSAVAMIPAQPRSEEMSKAESLFHLAQSCSDASTLLYTVSESAGALYLRYANSEEQTANQCGTVLEQCTSILKKNAGPAAK